MYRIGQGVDFHRFQKGRKLILGGVEIPSDFGLLGHSDADVLTHALMDALLGAAGLRDIGYYFPDTDPAYKGADSIKLLERTRDLIFEKKRVPVNVDVTVMAEIPKLSPYIDKIKEKIARTLVMDKADICVKATTTEKMGDIGKKEGMGALAVVLLKKT